ncbi:DUF1761 domain-containing protein [Candidatus Nomurabacteria bacterium]|nr:DUF1761 domain-containing protein [Candidatus Nomurabacteria bacterium]
MEIAVNYFAIVVATVINTVLGFIWYGPLLGKPWMKEMGFTEEHMRRAQEKGMTQNYILMIIGALLLNYVLAYWILVGEQAFGTLDVQMAMVAAFWAWLGFIATTMLGQVLWDGKSWKLYAINIGYYLVSLEIAAIIITLWR